MRKKEFIYIFKEYFKKREDFIKAHEFILSFIKYFKDSDYDVMNHLDHNLVKIDEEKLLEILINDFSYLFDE